MDLPIDALNLNKDQPIVISNHHGVIVYVNPHFENLFQWTAEEIVNQSLLTIIPPGLHDAHNIGFSRFITTEKPVLLGKAYPLPSLKKNGEQFNALHLINAVKVDNNWIIGANISPIEAN